MDFKIYNLFSNVLKNINRYKFTYISIAAIIQLMLICGLWIISRIFQLALTLAGEEHLDKNNILHILTNPYSFVILNLLVLIVAFFMFIEFSILTFTIYGQLTEKQYSFRSILDNAWNKTKNLAGFQTLFFIFYFLITIPTINLGVKSVLAKNLFIPKFISSEIMKTNSGLIIWGLIMIVFAYLNLRLIFTLPLTAVGDENILDSIKRSWELTKTGKRKLVFTILLFEIIYLLIAAVLTGVITYICIYFDNDGNNPIIQTLFFSSVSGIIFFLGVISKITVITSLITVLIDHNEISEKLVNNLNENKKKSRLVVTFTTVIIVVAVLINGFNIYGNGVNKNIKTIAHRGYVAKGVENSIEALEGAAEVGADYVEFDIILTKDNKFVVMHDFNLKRLVGLNKRVQDMNFDEVVGLTIKQGDFSSKIPSLEEFVNKAKELNMNLVIELKPHGAEPPNYIDILIDEVKRLKLENYKFMSLNSKVMEELETKVPNLETGYVIPLQFGNFHHSNVDFFVIEDFSYRDHLVEQARKENKHVFVWTINNPALITKYLQSPADGIITDEPELVKEEKDILENHYSYFDKILRLVNFR
ncbi:glycerophosphoryl diester phosphodiesterase membrane domain-containing protein [Gemella haemolysans]|uniref:Glycerophosphodiester phosphodiesterase family protein n=1 Tax=Gemella haemolysans ATCC 10379 TaxID=546270 RepID=C5NV37_9BACL|nr:glycerophosphodiester phosphodiesterase [Gemella haemolysans]EER68819.1 glycerophosphodiester phosphodiesterase family protein [Gemella haemolysans ATCC 10379]KAA8707058.1 glycerophosphodiester phosphodiesterase [Gemella haemolysans]UBH81926.1 glycerophosphodiester phosphodiesterase [Gemella haemolysans]VEI38158.1 Glycerophosphoryl diester phosphodiesterase [Gemella haemolysans]